MQQLRIVFLGTPEFAVPMLEVLHRSHHKIAGVVTAPDKPAGRGMQLQQSDVKKYAVAHQLPLLQPSKLKDENFLNELRDLNADLFVVVAFRMLPEVLWSMPPLGTINLHASLLPQYRGAAPINWAIINGEKETGVTTFRLQQQIDTGKIIFQEKIPIGDSQNVGGLYRELMALGSSVLLKTVNAIAAGSFPQIAQDHITDIHHAPKIFKATCEIDWKKSTAECYNLIRGLSPYPAAYTTFRGKILKIFSAGKTTAPPSSVPGEFETDNKTYLKFFTADGALSLADVQWEGKKRMPAEEFIRGLRTA